MTLIITTPNSYAETNALRIDVDGDDDGVVIRLEKDDIEWLNQNDRS